VLNGAGLYLLLILAAIALFYLAYSLRGFDLLAFAAAGVVFACLVALFLAARRVSTISEAKPLEAPSTLLTPTVIVNEIRAAALVTFSQVGTVTVRKERDRASRDALAGPLRDKFFGEELVMDVGVRVVAGVNLKHLRESDVIVEGDSAKITLPPTKVLMVYVDESLTRVVSHRSGWFTGKDISLMDAARREAMEALVNAAIDKDLFEKAGNQAAVAIAGIARSLGCANVTVHPTQPKIGAHYEELQDPVAIAKITALPPDEGPRRGLIGEE
jgi:hypothetical protein